MWQIGTRDHRSLSSIPSLIRRLTLEESNDAGENERGVGVVRLEWSLPRKSVTRDTLGLHAAHHGNVRSSDGDPREGTTDSDRGSKVTKDSVGVVGRDEESETHEASGEGKGDPRNTTRSALGEDTGSIAVLGHAVKSTGGNVLVRVGGGEAEKKDTSVDERREDLDLGVNDGEDEGRGGSTTLGTLGRGGLQGGGVGVNNHADAGISQAIVGHLQEDGENVEEDDSVEGLLNGRWDSLARVLGLADGDTDELGAHVGEEGENKRIEETEETAEGKILGDFVWLEGAAVLPVAETDTGGAGDTSEVDDECQEDQAGEGKNLDE